MSSVTVKHLHYSRIQSIVIPWGKTRITQEEGEELKLPEDSHSVIRLISNLKLYPLAQVAFPAEHRFSWEVQ